MEKIFQRIRNIVAGQFEIKPEQVEQNTHFKYDLGADSMDLIMIIVEVENIFGFTIPTEDLPKILTPSSLVNVVQRSI